VAHYFASDVHLRRDCPDRDRRFRGWLDRLNTDDALILLGDLCDFWMGARSRETELLRSPSLQALAARRRQGGSLAMMPGNHDAWLCPFYERELGARIIHEPHDLTVHRLRLRLVHGHLLGARRLWKSWMESRLFFDLFGRLPGPIAGVLDRALTWRNRRGLLEEEERHLRVFRAYAQGCQGMADLVLIGHVHRPVDEGGSGPRLLVLGGWQHHGSFLRIDENGADFHVERDRAGDGSVMTGAVANSMDLGAVPDEH
jgi:UDP-2,3-diacylglucosamine hydrolase